MSGESVVADDVGRSPRVPRRAAVWGAAVRHPALTVAVIGLLYTVVQMVWIARFRFLGAFNVDEEGGLAAALRFHRNLELDPRPLARVVFSTWNGPLVPLLAVPALVLGPRTAATAMVVQPLLVVAAACGVAGIVGSTGNRRAAIVSGLVVLGLPISIVSARSFQYSTGVGAFLALGLWALLASDRGRNRWRMVAFGAAIGAMLLCRTMSAGFLPGVAVASLVLIVWTRRAIVNLVIAASTALVVAGPWWYTQWDAIMRYLAENAYGDRAHYWGSVSVRGRIEDHTKFFRDDFRLLLVLPVLMAGLVLVGALWRSRRDRFDRWFERPREVLAVGAVGILGFAALFSTSNVGFWFAYPLDVVLVAAFGLIVVALPDGLGPRSVRWKSVIGSLAVAIAATSFVASQWITGARGFDASGIWQSVIGTHGELQGGNIEADPRMASPDVDERRRAAHEWLAASTEVAETIEALQRRHGTVLQTVTGEIHLLNANTIALTEEVTGQGLSGVIVNNTLEPPDRVLRRDLTPLVDGVPRVLVIVHGRSLGFPNGRGSDRFRRLAIEEGWQVHRTVRLPDGGHVEILIDPESISEP